MNLHTLKSNKHELFGNYMQEPSYWCSCGWNGQQIGEHAADEGLINAAEGSLLYYCRSHDRNVCNRILTDQGIDCKDHQL